MMAQATNIMKKRKRRQFFLLVLSGFLTITMCGGCADNSSPGLEVEIKSITEGEPDEYVPVKPHSESYKAIVSDSLDGDFKWDVSGGNLEVVEPDDEQVAIITGLKASPDKNKNTIELKFTPEGSTEPLTDKHQVYVFGGEPVAANHDFVVSYRLLAESPSFTFEAAPNQPRDIVYQWVSLVSHYLFIIGRDNRETVLVQSENGVGHQQVAGLRLRYRPPGGTSSHYDHDVKIRRPKSVVGTARTRSHPRWGYITTVTYTVKDQWGDTLAYDGMTTREELSLLPDTAERWNLDRVSIRLLQRALDNIATEAPTDEEGVFLDVITPKSGILFSEIEKWAEMEPPDPITIHQRIFVGEWLVKEHDIQFLSNRASIPGVQEGGE